MNRIGGKYIAVKRFIFRRLFHKVEKIFFECFEANSLKTHKMSDRQDHAILSKKFAELKKNSYDDVIAQLQSVFPQFQIHDNEKELRLFIDNLAKRTLVYNAPVRLVHASGLILYSVVCVLAKSRPYLRILETGTSRGFSSVTMAKALHDSKRDGNIITVDVLPPEKPILWSGLIDELQPMTRYMLLNPWECLVEKYITYIQFSSPKSLNRLGVRHIDFAYVDAMHDYQSVFGEFTYIAEHQRRGDFVLFDDVGVQFPGVEQAVKEISAQEGYVERARFSTHYRPQPWLLCEKV